MNNDLLEQYSQTENFSKGDLKEAKVLIVDEAQKLVFIDLGTHSNGYIHLNEFETKPKEGQIVKAIYVKSDQTGLLFSISSIKRQEFEASLENAVEEKKVVRGKITKLIEGKGFEVTLDYDIKAFLPLSLVDVKRIEDPSIWVGREDSFKIQSFEKRQRRLNIVVDRKSLLLGDVQAEKTEFFKSLELGQIVEGKVIKIGVYGAILNFNDNYNLTALLPKSEFAWNRVRSLEEHVSVGEKLTVKITQLDKEKGQMKVSYKVLKDNPWNSLASKFTIDQKVEGTVTHIIPLGAFVEIIDGIEGFIPISEFSWVKKVKTPAEIVSVGQKVEVMIKDLDVTQERLILSIKALLENPWIKSAAQYKEGSRVKGIVKKILDKGAIIKLENNIDGYLSCYDYSWVDFVQNLSNCIKEGEELELYILEYNAAQQKIKLSRKHLESNPWETLANQYPQGSAIEVTVLEKKDNGVEVKINDQLDSFIHVNHLSSNHRGEETLLNLKIGDKVKAAIIDINPRNRKVVLSSRALEENESHYSMKSYLANSSEETYAVFGKNEKK